MSESPFVVGAEVVIVTHYDGRRLGSRRKVAKVYKNGNFLLEQHNAVQGFKPRQWKPEERRNWGLDQEYTWVAYKTGDGRYREHLEVWDEAKHGAELARDARKRETYQLAERFATWLKLNSEHLTDEQMEVLTAMIEKRDPRVGTDAEGNHWDYAFNSEGKRVRICIPKD